MAPSDDTHSDDGGCLVEDLDVRSQRPTPENRPSLFASRTRLLNGRGKRDTPPEVLVVASSGSRDAVQVDARSEAGGPNQPHALGAAASSSSPSGPFVAFKRYLSGKLNSSSRADSPATSRSASKSGPHAIDAAPPMTSPHSSPPPDQERPQQALPHDEQPPAVPQSFAAPPSAVPQDLPAAGQFNRAPAAYSPFEVWCQASANGADDATLLSLAQATGLITTNTATGDVTLSPSLPLNPSAAHSPFSRPESMGPASVGLGHGPSTGGYPTHSPTPGSRPSSLFGTPASSSLMYSALAEPHSSSVLYPSSAAAAAPGANNPLFTLSFGPNSGNDAPVDAAPRMMLPSAAIPRFLPAAGASDDPVTPTLAGSTSNASAAAAAAASQFFTSHASSAAQPSSSSNAMLAGLTALGGPPPGTSSSAANLPMSPGASTGAGQQPPLSPDAASKSHPLYKTELCRGWLETGSCRYGSKCQFAHGHEELRPVPRHPKYKTELCRAFALTGTCSYGARCRFIHGTPGSLSAGTEFGPGQHVSAPLTGCGANMGSADEMAAALWHSTTTGRTGGMEPGMEGVETLGEPAGWSTLQQQPAYMGGAPRTSAPGSLLPGAGTSKPGDRTPRFFPGLQQRQTLLALLQQEAAMQAPQPPAARQHMSSEAAAMLSTLNAMTGISAAPGLAGGRASMDAPPMSPLESMLSGMDASGLMHMGAMGRMDVLGMQEAMRRASADESVRRMSMESLFQPPSVISGASQRMSLESAGNRSSMESSQSAQLWTPAAQRDAAWAAGQLASSQLQSAGSKLGWPSPTRGCAYDADVFGKADSLMPRPGVGVVGESKAHVARTGSLPAGPAAPYGVGQRAAGMRSASMRQPDAVAADSALLNQYLLTLAAQQQQQGR